MSFCYCQNTAGVFVWVTKKKKIAITSLARAGMSNPKWVQLIILTTEFTLDKQSVYQMICPRKVVILTKCYSLQLCSSHYRIANSSERKNCSSKILNSIHLSFSCGDQAATCCGWKDVVIMKLLLKCLLIFRREERFWRCYFLISNFRHFCFLEACLPSRIDINRWVCKHAFCVCAFFNVHIIFCVTSSFQPEEWQ